MAAGSRTGEAGGSRWVSWTPALLLALLGVFMVALRVPAAAVNVRWAPGVSAQDRARLERGYLLAQPERKTLDTVAYVLLDGSRGNIRRLVQDPNVADTHGVSRSEFVVDEASNVSTYNSRVLVWADRTGLLAVAVGLLAWLTMARLARTVLGLPARSAASRLARTALALPVFAVFLLAGYLTTGRTLSADDSFSVWVAQAVLRGDRVYQDVFDAGAPLLWWLSLAGQWVSGGRVIGEVGVAVLMGAVGSLLTAALAWRASGSATLATWAGALACAAACATQLYGYPKMVLYPAALAVLWWYASHPVRGRGVALGLVVAAALLTRHDHGLYVGLAAATAVALATGPVPFWKRAAVAVLAAVVPLLPWLAVVASREDVVRYFTSRIELANYLGVQGARPVPDLGLAWPLLGWDEPWPVRVNVQWRDGLADAGRLAGEQALGLQPVRSSTELYELRDTSSASVERLVRHQDAWAVRGVDVLAGRPTGPQGLVFAVHNWLAVRSIAPLPQLLGRPESSRLLYSIAVITPLMAMILMVPFVRRVLAPEGRMAAPRFVLPAVVLLAGAHFGLARRPAQIVETLPLDLVLLAWVLWQCWSAGVPRAVLTVLRTAVVVTVVMVGLLGVDAVHAGDLFEKTEFVDGAAGARAKATRLWTAHTAARPIDVFAPEGTESDRVVVRYLQVCTRPTDRIWEPTGNFATPYYADRGIVEHLFWYAGFRASEAEQRQTLRWVQARRVPLVIVRTVGQPRDVFAGHPIIQAYVRDHYVDVTSERARSSAFTGGRPLTLLARRDLVPTGQFEPLDLPCFAD
ncbi:MAG: hypothetical protein ABL971_04715 [Vicinamibacterales bacterium]